MAEGKRESKNNLELRFSIVEMSYIPSSDTQYKISMKFSHSLFGVMSREKYNNETKTTWTIGRGNTHLI